MRYIAPIDYIFWKRDEALPAIGQKLVALFDELELNDHPVIFHVFSGAGCMVLNAFYRALETCDEKDMVNIWDRIIGVVFDSCPAHASYYQRALAYHAGESRAVGYYQQQFTFLLNILFFVFNDLFQYFRGFFTTPHVHYSDELLRHKLPGNQLFLYSTADSICSHEHITEFASIQERKENSRVKKICWESSPHCQHLRYHNEGYRNAIADFVSKTLDEEEPGFERVEKPTEAQSQE